MKAKFLGLLGMSLFLCVCGTALAFDLNNMTDDDYLQLIIPQDKYSSLGITTWTESQKRDMVTILNEQYYFGMMSQATITLSRLVEGYSATRFKAQIIRYQNGAVWFIQAGKPMKGIKMADISTIEWEQ